jgi:4-amino-4-deoxy-L-arabinose transferase-like glycosyltransferase
MISARPLPGLARLTVWAASPGGATVLLILITAFMRVTFATALGLGFDESYMVAAGRDLQWGYFDHPPAAWWMAWAAARFAGTDAAVVVRLPFILLFGLTTALMYRVSASAFGARAGFWAACVLNIIPVLGVTAGSWVLPDGPLLAALLGMVACLMAALHAAEGSFQQRAASWGWWLGFGGCAGLALCSKYTAVLTVAGVGAYLVTNPAARRWLLRPQPYVALLAMLLIFAPVLVWNAQHGWVSFLFQAGRAGGRFHPFGPVATLAGEAFFVIPWVWLLAMWVFGCALRRGPADAHRWFFACLAAPPIVVFALLSFHSRILFHWASPGYMMLAPLMGAALARYDARALRLGLVGTAVFLSVALGVLGTEARYNWMSHGFETFAMDIDPDIEIVDWTSLRTELAQRGLLGRPGLIVAATKWYEAGKIDYALEGSSKVICLGSDPRQYGMSVGDTGEDGADVLIIAPRKTLAAIMGQFGTLFENITLLPPATVLHNGRPAMLLPLFLGRHFHVGAL